MSTRVPASCNVNPCPGPSCSICHPPHATGSRVCPCGWAGEYVYTGSMSGEKECPRCGRYESEARNATPDRSAIEVKVYPVEHRALRAAIDAVGSPPKLPDWYDNLANLWIRIEDSYGD